MYRKVILETFSNIRSSFGFSGKSVTVKLLDCRKLRDLCLNCKETLNTCSTSGEKKKYDTRAEISQKFPMSCADFILKKAPIGDIPDCSLGEYLLSKLRSHPPDLIIQVDADTGAQQTASEFLARSIRLSEGMKKLGLEENDIVGLMCRNCFEASEIVLGTWLCGAAISPTNGKMTVDEMKHYLELLRPKLLFCDEEAIDNATEALNLFSRSFTVILVGDNKKCRQPVMAYHEVLAEADVKNYKPHPVKSPSTQLVAIPMSSGTSGLPKAVALTHKNMIYQILNMKHAYPLNENLVILQISHFFWITGLLMFLSSLSEGSKRVLLRNTTIDNILKAIEKYKTEWSLMAPLLALSIVKSPNFEKCDVSSMKVLVFGGTPFTENIGKAIMEKWKNISLVQGYGTTEASGLICCTDSEDNIYSLGRVTPGVQLKIIDETGKPLKANTLGEILVRSPGIMKGYLRNEEATRESIDSEGWFHTGDLGYYDESGQVYLIDRIKEMIKIMNMQVAPAEIENVILNIPGIKEVAVTGVTKDGDSQELLALVVKEKNSTVTEKDIHAQIAISLSDYKKITGGIYFVDSLPKTASEKLHRREIRKIAESLC